MRKENKRIFLKYERNIRPRCKNTATATTVFVGTPETTKFNRNNLEEKWKFPQILSLLMEW